MTTPNPYTPEKEPPAATAAPERPLDAWVRRGLTVVTLLPWLYTMRRAVLILLPTTVLGHPWTPFVDIAVFASLLVGAVLVVARPRGARRSIGFWIGVAIASVALGQVAYFFTQVRLTERFGAPKIWPSDCHGLTDVRTCQGREFTSWMEPVAGTSYSRAEGSMAPDWCRAFFEKQPSPSENSLDPPEPCDFESVTGFVAKENGHKTQAVTLFKP